MPVEFGEGKDVRWKTAIHGDGWSSPVIWENQIWLTTGSDETEELFAVCVDLETGRILHDIKVFDFIDVPLVEAYKSRFQMNSPASPTPVVEEHRVYVHYGPQSTACLDAKTCEILWERRDLHCDQIQYGGSSPMVDEESLFVAFDGVDKQFFVALDKETGDTRWKQDRNVNSDWEATLRASGADPSGIMSSKLGDNKKSFATAHIIEHKSRRQVIAPGGEAIISYDPTTGEEFWRVQYLGHYNIAARPLFENGLVYVYVTGPSERMLAIRPDGTGDVTGSHVVWSAHKGVPNMPSPIIVDEVIYLVSENGVARCLDSKTGDEFWKQRVGGKYWASPLFANGNLYFFSMQGDISVFTATKDVLELVSKNRISGEIISSPAVASNALILRTTTHLYCFVNDKTAS